MNNIYQTSNRSPNMYSIFSCIRDIVFIVIILYITCPESNLYSWKLSAILLGLWLFFAFISDTGYFLFVLFKKLGFLLAWPTFMIILSLVDYTSFDLYLIFIYIELIIFGYYILKKKKRILSIAIIFYIIYNFIISIYSINILNKYPNIARALASGDIQYASTLSSPFTSDYFYIYGVMLLTISLVPFFKNKKGPLLLFLICSLQVILIAKSQYTTALLGVILFSLINLLKTPKSKAIRFLTYSAFIFGSIFLFPTMYKLFDWLSLQTSSYLLKVRFLEVSNILKNMEFISGSDSEFRLFLYKTSFETFLSNPFLGVGDIGNTSNILGYHSTILDNMAKYGIIGGFIYFGTFIMYFKFILKQIPNIYKGSYKFILIVLIVLSLINTTIDSAIMLIVTFIIPTLYIVPFRERRKV